MERRNEKILDKIRTRANLLYGAFVLVAVLLVFRLVQVQLSGQVHTNSERLRDRIIFIDSLEAHRGAILARDGRPLAESVFRKAILFDFGSEGLDVDSTFDRQARQLARKLALHFKDRSADWYYGRMRKCRDSCFVLTYLRDSTVRIYDSWFSQLFDICDSVQTIRIYDTLRRHSEVRLFRDVSYDEWEKMRREYPILNGSMGAVTLQRIHDARVYPYDRLAIISSELGGERIEDVFRERLGGRNGYQWRQRIAPNFAGRVDDTDYREAVDGMDVVTTIDTEIQDVVHSSLHRAMVEEHAVWGTSIVMECTTGDIVAMSNLGRKGSHYSEVRNYAVGKRLEPGSTFKLATMLALIDDAGVPTSREYFCNRGKKVKLGETASEVEDSHNVDEVAAKESGNRRAKVNMRCAFKESSNVYFARAVLDAYGEQPQRFTDYLRDRLHLGETAGLDTIGEIGPRLYDLPLTRELRRRSIDRLIHMSFGYGVELAPIQTLRLYNAIANGGRMVAPRIIRQIRHGDKVVEEFPVRVIDEKICSDEALMAAREFMKEAALTGTGKHIFGKDSSAFRVALKTGTARFAQGDILYADGYYLNTMVSFMPVENPKYTILTAILKRKGEGRHKNPSGAFVAGLPHKRISTYLYNHLEQCSTTLGSDEGYRPVDIKGGDIASIRRVAGQLSPYVNLDSREGWGRAGIDAGKGVNITSMPAEQGIVPDVEGMGLSDALFLLESSGLRVRFKGSGRVVGQSLAAGSAATPGTEIKIVLK